jgi:D-alanyl-lipoteichoic acid acyltransferase DltB (MBOAT superfamily)
VLFNSHVFLFVFLPATILAYYTVRQRAGHRAALAVLIAASFVYYGWWNPIYVPLLVGSLLFNFVMGRAIDGGKSPGLLAVGIAVNLLLLGVFKYADFFIDTANALGGEHFNELHILLPLGLSFITFQKIAFLVDVHRGVTSPRDPLAYTLFVVFFPQLIAGPIVHHRDIARQFSDSQRVDNVTENLAIGLSVFAFGLAKKVLLADTLATFASPVFEAAHRGDPLSLQLSWMGALAYMLQLFFDFSGYSDMALGLARMFGYHLPINFNAPYRSTSIVDFWRRWHLTLAHFLRDYLYFPLGGSRHGEVRHYLNLMTVMTLGGLWHGAAWTFVIWGALHGVYLIVNQLWRRWRGEPSPETLALNIGKWLMWFAFFLPGLIIFRAANFDTTFHIYGAMLGLQEGEAATDAQAWLLIAAGFAIVWFLPDTPRIFERALDPAVLKRATIAGPVKYGLKPQWAPSVGWALTCGAMMLSSAVLLSKTTEFIYYQF